jgi:hypothetical protein
MLALVDAKGAFPYPVAVLPEVVGLGVAVVVWSFGDFDRDPHR